jgi:O-antigen/teichoic acid export membrane protein
VTSIRDTLTAWRQDNLLRKVLRNTSYLFVGNTLSSVVQSILAARLLGVLGFGILGTVIAFASNINRLLSFRMGELVIKYMGQFLAQEKKEHAAAVLKAATLTETLTSVVAYLLLVLLSPWAARYIAKDVTTAPLFTFYALALLTNFVAETSTAVLQVGDHFRSQAIINFLQSFLTVALIVYAFLVHGNIWLVLTAYLLGKSLNGLALAAVALHRAGQMLGPGWWRASFRMLPPRREFWGFALSTNLSATVSMLIRDNEVVWVSYFLSPLEAGYYKLALAVINLMVMPITPFINTTFPELTRAVAQKAWLRLRDLLKKMTIISGAWTGAVVLALVVVGNWLITTFYGKEYGPATPAALILLIGYGVANVLYWNRTLLLSLGLPNYPLKAIAFTGSAKLILGFFLVPRFGYLAEAALLSGFFVISIGLIVARGLLEIRNQQSPIRNPQ